MTNKIDHPIFGLLDASLDITESASIKRVVDQKPQPIPNVKPRPIPALRIVEQPALTVACDNVVEVPEALLKLVSTIFAKETKRTSKFMLRNVVPQLLAFDAAVNYSTVALRDGLGIEVAPDPGLAESIKYNAYLSLVFYYVKSLPLPRSLKKRYMERIADNLADEAVKELVGKNKSQQISDSIAQLHAQVYKNTIGTGSTKTGGRIRRQGQGDEE